jgi:hypothetical protein
VDETLAVATLLLGRCLCLECVGAKAGIDRHTVLAAIRLMERGVVVAVRQAAPCEQCGMEKTTYSIPL